MDPVSATPTEPRDYAAINLAYAALLGALALSPAARRAAAERLRGGDVLTIGAATFALSKTVAHEKVGTWLRVPVVEETPAGERRPRGRGLRYAAGELVTCTRCLGAWSALAIVGLRATSPPAGQVVTSVLAASTVNDFLQAAFALTRDCANLAAGRLPATDDA
jgi:hypothetical protein